MPGAVTSVAVELVGRLGAVDGSYPKRRTHTPALPAMVSCEVRLVSDCGLGACRLEAHA